MKVKPLQSFMLLLLLAACSAAAYAQSAKRSAPVKKKTVQQAPASVPFQYNQSLIFVKAQLNGSRTQYLFLVNTGANTTVINKKTADLLRLPVIRDTDTVEGTAGKEHVTLCSVKSINIGKAIVKNMEVSSRDLSKFVTLNGQKIDGILGTDFLKNFAVTIDFNTKTLAFASKKVVPGKQKTMPFKVVDGIPRFTVRLNDTLDTYLHYNSGVAMNPSRNNYINVSYDQWQQLKKLTPHMNHSNFVSGQGVGGSVYMQVVKIHGLKLCDLDVKSPYMVVQSKEGYFRRDDAIGFFGNNLLEKQKKVTIDFLGERIVIQSPPATSNAKKPVKKKKI